MSVLLKKVLWFRKSDLTVAYNLTDAIDSNVGRGLDIKNNIVQILLKNPGQRLDSASNIVHKYVNSEGKILFEEQDQIKIYLDTIEDYKMR